MHIKVNYKNSFYAFLLVLLGINLFLFYNRQKKQAIEFKNPVPVGTKLAYSWAISPKPILFFYIKPTCPICIKYKNKMNGIATRFNSQINVIGLCTKNFKNIIEKSKNYQFKFYVLDIEKHNALHLAFTPQAILIENQKVLFAFNFNSIPSEEFERLNNFLGERYGE